MGIASGAGCEGIALFLDKKWQKLATDTSSVMDNRAQYIILNGLPGGKLGFLNVYALNNTLKRTQL